MTNSLFLNIVSLLYAYFIIKRSNFEKNTFFSVSWIFLIMTKTIVIHAYQLNIFLKFYFTLIKCKWDITIHFISSKINAWKIYSLFFSIFQYHIHRITKQYRRWDVPHSTPLPDSYCFVGSSNMFDQEKSLSTQRSSANVRRHGYFWRARWYPLHKSVSVFLPRFGYGAQTMMKSRVRCTEMYAIIKIIVNSW